MRISIWQQWASNHSTDFTVVGSFASVDEANKAAEELRALIAKIARWLERNGYFGGGEYWDKNPDAPLSPPEIEASKMYGVEWSQHSMDWFPGDETATDAIVTYDNMVFIYNISDTWLGSKPIDTIAKKLGGDVVVHGDKLPANESDTDVYVTISCIVLDKKAAAAIYTECQAYFERERKPRDYGNEPWRPYVDLDYIAQLEAHHRSMYDFSLEIFSDGFKRSGAQLNFENLYFFNIHFGLPALLNYLKAHQCRDIQLTLVEG
jgi:hypothetical protein